MLQMTVPNCCKNILTDWMCHKVFAVSKYSKLEWSHTVIVVHSTNYQQHRLVTIRRVAFIKNPNCQFLVKSKVANMDNCLLYKGEKHINRNTHKPYVSSSLRPLQKNMTLSYVSHTMCHVLVQMVTQNLEKLHEKNSTKFLLCMILQFIFYVPVFFFCHQPL